MGEGEVAKAIYETGCNGVEWKKAHAQGGIVNPSPSLSTCTGLS